VVGKLVENVLPATTKLPSASQIMLCGCSLPSPPR
jgi:hypothetical protein